MAKTDFIGVDIDVLPISGLLDAPVIYADGYRSAMLSNGVVKVTFFQNLPDPNTAGPERRVAAVLTMPLEDFKLVAAAFASLVASIDADEAEARLKNE